MTQCRQCKVFYCDRRRGRYCCADCTRKCDNRCLNQPRKCGNVGAEPFRRARTQ